MAEGKTSLLYMTFNVYYIVLKKPYKSTELICNTLNSCNTLKIYNEDYLCVISIQTQINKQNRTMFLGLSDV